MLSCCAFPSTCRNPRIVPWHRRGGNGYIALGRTLGVLLDPKVMPKSVFFSPFPPFSPHFHAAAPTGSRGLAHRLWQQQGGQVPRGAVGRGMWGKLGQEHAEMGNLQRWLQEEAHGEGLALPGGDTRGWGPPRTGAAAQRRLAGTPRGFGPELRCECEEEGARGAGPESIGRGRKRGGEKYIKEQEMNNCRQRAKSGLSPPPFLKPYTMSNPRRSAP